MSSDFFKAALTGANEFLQVIDKIVFATHGLAILSAEARRMSRAKQRYMVKNRVL